MEVNVIFDQEYLTAPIVSITPRGESALNSDFRYVVTNETTKGFTVKINKAQMEKLEFNWNAFSR